MATYVALRPMKVGNDLRQPGELVPEAADWHDIRPWIGSGYVKEITDEEAARIRGEKKTDTRVEAAPAQDEVGVQGTPGRKTEGAEPVRPRPLPKEAKK